MSGALAGRSQAKELNRGRVEATKVRRYWPGKRPDWVKEDEEGQQDDDDESAEDEDEQQAPAEPAPEAAAVRTGIAAPVIVKKADDPRLRRLAGAQPAERSSARERHREVAEPQVVRRRERPESGDEDGAGVGRRMGLSDEEEEDEEAVAARRAAVRERLRQQQELTQFQQQQEAAGDAVEEEEESEEEDDSEYTTDDSEDEALGGRQLMKPVFVPKTDRETIQEREMLEKEEEQRAQQEKMRLEQRKDETREIVAQRVQEEEAMAANMQAGPKGLDEIDTDDEKDEEGEYETWKLREMRRIARDREEREREVKEAEERERWRTMSEEERQRWLRLHPKTDAPSQKKKWRFLQKYWHRGAFFQNEADTGEGEDEGVVATIQRRDFSAPTGEDKMDKTMLPQIMQVKNFGRRGRTKWTHLVSEDTTNFESPWAQNDVLRLKYNQKMAAAEQVFTKPKNMKT
ncbi:hypothetical protein N2152v2_006604 [Parachlorella kessleri]